MIRTLFATAALLATPALAEDVPIIGASPTPTIEVHEGDVLTTAKPLVERSAPDGTITRRYPVWIDRTNGKGFQLTATTLRLAGKDDRGYVYAVLDGLPAPVIEAPVVTPVETSTSASRNIVMPDHFINGVNLAGCTFVASGALCPTPQTMRDYAAKGFEAFRVPISGDQMEDPKIVARMVTLADTAITLRATMLIDRHDYKAVTPADTDKWVRFVGKMPASPFVAIDLMNEPKMKRTDNPKLDDFELWARGANALIAGLRANGVKNIIHLEWPGYSGVFRFDKHEKPGKICESAVCAIDKAGGLVDPLGLTILSGHNYLDKGSSGTSKYCDIYTGPQNFANLLRAADLKGSIGEFGYGKWSGVDKSCAIVGPQALAEMRASRDVLVDYYAWGGGQGWKEDYFLKIEPTKGTFMTRADSPYLKALTGR